MDRGHIHYILTNPVYAGRIRHKNLVHEGQHPAIIDPTVWNKVQEMLKAGAARSRGHQPKAFKSLLAGKQFDETGDRLTPSHSRKNGKRLRYYISRHLVADRSSKHPDAWPLPANQIEELLSQVITNCLTQSDTVLQITRDLDAVQVESASAKLAAIDTQSEALALIHRANLKPGAIAVTLAPDALAACIQCSPEQIDPNSLVIEAPFETRRRGVELKLYLGSPPPEVDRLLIQNIVNAQRWLRLLTEGRSYSQIAEAEGISRRRIQSLIDLALLSPDTLDAIASGKQHDGLSINYFSRNTIPADWSDQSRRFATL